MALDSEIFGVSTNDDLAPGLLRRDTRPFRYKASGFVSSYKGHIFILLGLVIGFSPIAASLTAGIPQFVWLSDLALMLVPPFYLYSKNKNRKYPFREPIAPEQENIDWENGGLFILGTDYNDNAQVSFSNDDVRTHMLVMGSTGSGKTRFLLGLMYQAMLMGAGAMYVDGKGDNTVFWLLYSMARRLGREDDLLVINYLTGGDSISAQKKGSKDNFSRISNTSNLLAHGSAEQLRSLLVGLMREAGGDGAMWKGRASAMLKGLLNALVYMRDSGEINLDVDTLRQYMPLEEILELFGRRDFPDSARISIHRYLHELPGFTEQSALEGNLNPEAYKQHGFLLMQLTEVLSDLSDTYGHIFSAPLGEVDFKDVVFNRRILFVMLPALEKDPDALAGLGKLVVAGVRSALAPALGNSVEGSYREIVQSKPTTSRVPFLCVLDEYGYYCVQGFAVVAAQARSLGVACVFAGQDYPSFKKGSEVEAASTVANTNIKISMKLEDPKETADLFVTRGGDSATTEVSGYTKEKSSQYQDNLSTKIEKKKRIDARDLVSQKPGEAHIIFGDSIVRGRFFYADPEQSKHARLNHLVMVDKGSEATIKRINSAYENFQRRLESLSSTDPIDPEEEANNTDPGLSQLFDDMQKAISRGASLQDASLYATGMIELRENLKDVMMAKALEGGLTDNSSNDTSSSLETVDGLNAPLDDSPKDEFLARLKARMSTPSDDIVDIASEENSEESKEAIDRINDSESSSSENNDPDMIDGNASPDHSDESTDRLKILDESSKPKTSVKESAEKVASEFKSLISETLKDSMIKTNRGRPLSPAQIRDTDPVTVLSMIEEDAGKSAEAAKESAEKTVDGMASSISYPDQPVPERQPADIIRDRLQGFLSKVAKKSEGT